MDAAKAHDRTQGFGDQRDYSRLDAGAALSILLASSAIFFFTSIHTRFETDSPVKMLRKFGVAIISFAVLTVFFTFSLVELVQERYLRRTIDHLVAAGAGWGGLPRTAAFYIMGSVEKNDGKTPHAVTVKGVPVDAFWSITVYNADGYLEANDRGVNSYNNFSARPNEDGSYTIHLGGDQKSVNYLPITEGWNYAVRMYQPRQEILDGTWTFPGVEPVK